jgi:hypothetical protein
MRLQTASRASRASRLGLAAAAYLLCLCLLSGSASPAAALTVFVDCRPSGSPGPTRTVDVFDLVGRENWLVERCGSTGTGNSTAVNTTSCQPCSPGLASLTAELDELRIVIPTSEAFLRIQQGASDFAVSQSQLVSAYSSVTNTASLVAKSNSLAFDPQFATCRRQSASCLDCTSLPGCGQCGSDLCLPGGVSGSTYTTCSAGWSNATEKCCPENTACSQCISQSDCFWCDGLCYGNSLTAQLALCQDVTTSNQTCPSSSGQTRENVTLGTGFKVQRVSKIKDGRYCYYTGLGSDPWDCRFKVGIDIGHTTPGHRPQDLSPSVQDYLSWFPEVHALGVNTIRTFALQGDAFYAALQQYNSFSAPPGAPLRVLHGIYPPEDALFSFGNAGGINVFKSNATNRYKDDISAVLKKVHEFDVEPYLVGYMVGMCVDPRTVATTDAVENGRVPVGREYVANTVAATPFEIYMSDILDFLVKENAERYRWQHPVAFQGCQTLDPILHPKEPETLQDYGSIDPNHFVANPLNMPTGLFLTATAAPSYPTFMRYEYNTCVRCKLGVGDADVLDPLAGYVRQLRERSPDDCLVMSVDGIATSSAAGRAAVNTNQTQGGYTEHEAARELVNNLKMLFHERVDFVFLFELFDEWFKVSWNAKYQEFPESERHLWKNPMNLEQYLGILAIEPVAPVTLDGNASDWDVLLADPVDVYLTDHGSNAAEDLLRSAMTFDEEYLYVMVQKKSGRTWSFPGDELYIGFDTVSPGGSKLAVGILDLQYRFLRDLESILVVKGSTESDGMWVNSAYDSFFWLWHDEIKQDNLMPTLDAEYWTSQLSIFHRWSLLSKEKLSVDCTSRPLQQQEVAMFGGDVQTLRASGDIFDADFVFRESVLEIRIPWTSIGFTSPSSGKVYDYPHRDGRNLDNFLDNHMFIIPSAGISLELKHKPTGGTLQSFAGPQASFDGKVWASKQIKWKTRRKAGFDELRTGIATVHNSANRPFCANLVAQGQCQDSSPVRFPCTDLVGTTGASADGSSSSSEPFCIPCVVIPAVVVVIVVALAIFVSVQRKVSAKKYRVTTLDATKTALRKDGMLQPLLLLLLVVFPPSP